MPVGIGLAAATFLVVAGGLFLYLIQTIHGHPLPSTDLMFPIALIIVFAVIIALFALMRRPFGVALMSEGVEIAYPLRRIHLAWSELMTVRFVGQGVVVFRSLTDQVDRFGRACTVSFEQARAILTDSRCPKVVLRDDQRHLLFEN
ncbi:MAG: hypothetical protein ACLQAS_06075 [Thermoplasmata archaeon]